MEGVNVDKWCKKCEKWREKNNHSIIFLADISITFVFQFFSDDINSIHLKKYSIKLIFLL